MGKKEKKGKREFCSASAHNSCCVCLVYLSATLLDAAPSLEGGEGACCTASPQSQMLVRHSFGLLAMGWGCPAQLQGVKEPCIPWA